MSELVVITREALRDEVALAVHQTVDTLLGERADAVRSLKEKLYVFKTWLTLDEAADYLGVERDTVAAYIRSGKVPASRPFGKLLYVKRSDLDEVIASGLSESNY